MTTQHDTLSFWAAWLRVVCAGVALFGLTLVLAPTAARLGFSLLLFRDGARLERFAAEAVAYISLSHAVLGSVMFGWAVLLYFVAAGPFREASPHAWLMVAASVCAWFVPDTLFSLWSGFWQNAVLNAVFATLFAIPLIATYRVFRRSRS
ncbi:hypothetical protein H0Z60_01355 [Ectothiorhodospiraceae bacterium WFHF3C12]|nr:hypothetical protein [Ectothiorhodospiraceae bacterium WFHF3C12]